ncbi:hypothetical protein Cgig2_018788 [Carnegiea gigantea]|uniref:Uncharacterized protein n=1 Tax=Carnegiea gigantea TaxID=171969 RepID=A0A9Q1K7M7_9CARY|nr:hypothetical protein Cgig2_018788 [Carnegiea gigantea]
MPFFKWGVLTGKVRGEGVKQLKERNSHRGFCSENNEDREQEWGFYRSRRVMKKRSEHNKGRKKKSSAQWRYRLRHWPLIEKVIEGAGGRDMNEQWISRRRWEGEGDSYVCFIGGMLVESGDGKVKYKGGSRKCMVVRKGMVAEELLKMARKMTGSDMLEEKLWYSLKYDREILVVVEVDSDVEVIFKGNYKHGYIYVAGNAGPMRRQRTRAAVCEARVSGRKCNHGEEVGEEHGNNEARVKRYDFYKDVTGGRRRGAAGEQAASRRGYN